MRRVENFFEEMLEPPGDATETTGDLAGAGGEALRSALAVDRITHENRSAVYSYRAQRILFELYEYRRCSS